jgi:hypothetical protein
MVPSSNILMIDHATGETEWKVKWGVYKFPPRAGIPPCKLEGVEIANFPRPRTLETAKRFSILPSDFGDRTLPKSAFSIPLDE